LETVSLRYFNVFGPLQDPQAEYAAVIPKFIKATLCSQPVTVLGDGSQTRDFTFVENVVQANLSAVSAKTAPGEAFNVGVGVAFDINTLVSEIRQLVGKPQNVVRLPPRAGDVPHSLADTSRAKAVLGYVPKVNFRDGLRRMIEWFPQADPGVVNND
jgi:UDP-N-acetylglucosamine/UDP-N-acetyl-alpha-D-glucosaminouronate 4-epimerase